MSAHSVSLPSHCREVANSVANSGATLAAALDAAAGHHLARASGTLVPPTREIVAHARGGQDQRPALRSPSVQNPPVGSAHRGDAPVADVPPRGVGPHSHPLGTAMPRRTTIPPIPLPRLRTSADAARRIGIGEKTLRRSTCPRYHLPAQGLARETLVRFSDVDVDTWIARQLGGAN